MTTNATLTEPKSLTRCGLWSLHKDNLRTWATGRCLLEHLGADEIDALTKEGLVLEILGAVLRVEVDEDRRAMATDTVTRPTRAIINGTA
jgi:hypothetical protein